MNLDPDVAGLIASAGPVEMPDLERLAKEDPAALSKVLREHGAAVFDYIRYNPANSVSELAKSLASEKKQVRTHVDGLYSNIPSTAGPPAAGWALDTTTDPTSGHWDSKIQDPSGAKIEIGRYWDPATGTLTMDTAFGSPQIAKVPSSPALIASTGETPAMAYANLHQMRAMGIPYGKGAASSPLKTVKMSTIQNFETIAHLYWLRERFQGSSMDELIVHTASYRYAADILLQAGYRVTSVNVDMLNAKPMMKRLLKHYENDSMSRRLFQQSGTERKGVHNKMLGRYGIDADEIRAGNAGGDIDANFDIYLRVEPIQ